MSYVASGYMGYMGNMGAYVAPGYMGGLGAASQADMTQLVNGVAQGQGAVDVLENRARMLRDAAKDLPTQNIADMMLKGAPQLRAGLNKALTTQSMAKLEAVQHTISTFKDMANGAMVDSIIDRFLALPLGPFASPEERDANLEVFRQLKPPSLSDVPTWLWPVAGICGLVGITYFLRTFK